MHLTARDKMNPGEHAEGRPDNGRRSDRPCLDDWGDSGVDEPG